MMNDQPHSFMNYPQQAHQNQQINEGENINPYQIQQQIQQPDIYNGYVYPPDKMQSIQMGQPLITPSPMQPNQLPMQQYPFVSQQQGEQFQDMLAALHLPSNLPPELFSQLLMTASDSQPQAAADPTTRGSWTQVEDDLLRSAVNQVGPTKWTDISRIVGTRSPKQCRERWANCLQPNLKRAPFEAWEDQIIIRKQSELGNHWAAIAQSLPGRSPGAVKNRWYSSLKLQAELSVQNQQMSNYDYGIMQTPKRDAFDTDGGANLDSK